MVDKIQHKIIIPEAYLNQRLDHVLAQLFPQYSRTQLQNWLISGEILIDGQKIKAKKKIRGGELVEINTTVKAQGEWQAQAIPLNVVYEDETILIINKPANLVVHPGAGNPDRTLLNALLHHAEGLRTLPRAGIVHRLDKDTSGLLIIAKTATALKDLQHQLKKHAITREYQAIVQGILISGGTIDAAISRHSQQRKRMAVNEKGKPSTTHYRILEKFRAHTLVKLKLATGRTHQIRVHLSHIHHPIVGDQVYGGRLRLAKNMNNDLVDSLRHFKRQALHAFALSFLHPETKIPMSFESDLPQDMQDLVRQLREDARMSK